MRQMIKKGRTENTQARRAGNLLMIAGVVTPIVGIAVTKFVEFEFETYRRVIQVIFITGLVLFIGGILVKNYWKERKTDERYDPSGLWSDANRAVHEKQFDWTGIGCSLLALGPGVFFIVAFLFAQEFEYAPFVGFGAVVLCVLVGNKLYSLGRARRARILSEQRDADALVAKSGVVEQTGANASIPDVRPLTTPEGYLLVDASEGVSCGIPFFGIFTAVWYGATFLFMFMVWRSGGDDTQKGMLFLSIFLLAGLLPLFFLIRLVRMARSFEKRAELLVPHWPLESGEEVEMTFHCNLKKALTVMSVDVTLECQKVDRSGSETQTSIMDTRSLSVTGFTQQDQHISAKWQMSMPSGWTLPHKVDAEEVNWKVNVIVPLAEGPKGVFNFQLLVVGGAKA